jgi:hypothetical protein
MIFAHQGGWDEMLMVLGPIAVIVFLLRVARRRAIREGAVTEEDDQEGVGDGSDQGHG